ncbi:MAG: hypothetical protein AB7O96_00945 [Pseudobdellovibrionaceae bacterium]
MVWIRRKEDAKFIVKAANNFHPLLEALKKLRKAVKDSGSMNHQDYDLLGIEVNQAIKAAEEGR